MSWRRRQHCTQHLHLHLNSNVYTQITTSTVKPQHLHAIHNIYTQTRISTLKPNHLHSNNNIYTQPTTSTLKPQHLRATHNIDTAENLLLFMSRFSMNEQRLPCNIKIHFILIAMLDDWNLSYNMRAKTESNYIQQNVVISANLTWTISQFFYMYRKLNQVWWQATKYYHKKSIEIKNSIFILKILSLNFRHHILHEHVSWIHFFLS